jgi:hypothetical protein
MLQQFYHNTRRARMQTTVMLGSADKQAESLLEDGYRFDAIIMSWLLSSVTTNIRFETLGGLLKKDGCLVITDADPENLRNQPLYGIDLGQVRIALRLRPVEPKQLEAAATSAGLELNETTPILKRDGSKYAFVQVYRALPADAPAGK